MEDEWIIEWIRVNGSQYMGKHIAAVTAPHPLSPFWEIEFTDGRLLCVQGDVEVMQKQRVKCDA